MHKYRAKPTTVAGIRFASKAEATRYGELVLLEKSRQVFKLECQPRYRLCPWVANLSEDDVLPELGAYVADFRYCLQPFCICAWGCVVEDVKGFKTPLYKWKKKHFEAQYRIQVREVTMTGRRRFSAGFVASSRKRKASSRPDPILREGTR